MRRVPTAFCFIFILSCVLGASSSHAAQDSRALSSELREGPRIPR
ncbi:hypothetical protein [Myxococcus stipitatus]|nr:hypothetical protein [Myxococcus stipitatus]